ncbi:hypothetical protein P175DRAFT_0504377 [Aspergillus ochraceoroseus IBT 24754]|uniref:Uncharacterized protein n=3 Tax=Aspergillus ochraceoroseus TaxID=138278 RepID=A0A2T5LMY3_9EURO|nr:uncharacterized protein P175DRAFT_0504377 [Aspergillus ochraceoroseus IBT 24754]KKK17403.1 hypothetical protein AOCH_007318 [Aspergillus ochraceoroseus]PTU17634.1 hypothetical protein P175DRAFT_0504377 [Aspergillus ochraceoroseus IBT 24754]
MTSECPPQTPAFQELSRIFATRGDCVLEIEILPPALGPFLQDEQSIGATKKYLVQAFVTARDVFFGTLSHGHKVSSGDAIDDDDDDDEVNTKLRTASEIILLFDCEHLTACNWRKKWLVTLLHGHLDQNELDRALSTELSLMTTYLCSPLHRHTKSPTLWQHRLWVLAHLVKLRKPELETTKGLFQAELAVGLRAGELHPKNYYAFNSMRELHHLLSGLGGEMGDWSILLARSIVDTVLDWCMAHPADISGLMFLLYLLDAARNPTLHLESVGKLVEFALDIGWEGESLWTCVDLSTRKFKLRDGLGQNVNTYPWNFMFHPAKDRDGEEMGWRSWVDKARIHWSDTRQTVNKPT